jgi:hypothetical protein
VSYTLNNRAAAKRALRHTLTVPAPHDASLIYLEYFSHAPIAVHLELSLGTRGSSHASTSDAPAASVNDLDEPLAAGGLAALGGSLMSAVGVLGGTLAHVSPTFVFDELVCLHFFGNAGQFRRAVVRSLTQQGIAQGYKVWCYV